MEFCDKCKGLLKAENNKLRCISCGNIHDGEIVARQKIKKPAEKGSGVIKEDKNIFADYDYKCKNCGYNKAQIIIRGPSVSDEDDIVMLRCGKCGKSVHLERKSM